jgi:hypothetical protein
MTVFFFHLQKNGAEINDIEGTELPDATAAKSHAIKVACELMAGQEDVARTWRLEVFKGGEHVLTLPFAASAETIGNQFKLRLRAIRGPADNKSRLVVRDGQHI